MQAFILWMVLRAVAAGCGGQIQQPCGPHCRYDRSRTQAWLCALPDNPAHKCTEFFRACLRACCMRAKKERRELAPERWAAAAGSVNSSGCWQRPAWDVTGTACLSSEWAGPGGCCPKTSHMAAVSCSNAAGSGAWLTSESSDSEPDSLLSLLSPPAGCLLEGCMLLCAGCSWLLVEPGAPDMLCACAFGVG